LTGNHAVLAWSIDRGTQEGSDLAGLKVVARSRPTPRWVTSRRIVPIRSPP
jgi:hypothetical protein